VISGIASFSGAIPLSSDIPGEYDKGEYLFEGALCTVSQLTHARISKIKLFLLVLTFV
jgi:hypothetical protein